MKNPETVLRELGDLYEFYRQIERFKIKKKKATRKSVRVLVDSTMQYPGV